MKKNATTSVSVADGGKNTDKLMLILRIASVVFMIGMIVFVVLVFRKYDIKMNLKEAGNISTLLMEKISGGLLAISIFIIVFTVGKSFALVIPPAVIFAVTGLCFHDAKGGFFLAVLVNMIATALSLIIPYYLGKLNGKSMVDSLKRKFKKIQKLDEFADKNDFALVLIVKASGMLPSDVSSLLFGAMNLSFGKYFLAANIGMLLLNVSWTALAVYGDITNPVSWLIVLPVLLVAVIPMLIIKKIEKKNAAGEASTGKDK